MTENNQPRRLLFNPGPVSVAEDVRQALLAPDMNHREPVFVDVLRRVRDGLTELLGGLHDFTCVPVVASGTGANEAVIALLPDPILVLVAGRYSERLALISERLGLRTRRLAFEPLRGIDIQRVAEALDAGERFRSLCFVHHETTTSVLAPMREICALARSRGVINLVDAVSSVFGHEIDIEADSVDFITLTANKGLEGLPGLTFVVARRKLLVAAAPSRSFYFDLHQQWNRMEQEGKPPFTHPAPLYFSTARAIERLRAETVAGRAARYRGNRLHLRDRLAAIGIPPYPLAAELCSNSLLLTHCPRDFAFDRVRDALGEQGIVIYTDQKTLDDGLMFFSTMGQVDRAEIDRLVRTISQLWSASQRQAKAH